MRELQHEEQDMYTKQRNDNMRGILYKIGERIILYKREG